MNEKATHIKQPYTLAEIKERIASNDYSAELLLQHAMLLLEARENEGGEATEKALSLADDLVVEWVESGTVTSETVAAVCTLGQLGYAYHGGEQWKPPLGKAPDFGLVNTLRDRISELQAELEAVGAGGVQALSAGPAVPEGWRDLIRRIQEAAEEFGLDAAVQTGERRRTSTQMRVLLEETHRAMLAASPTPPADQPAQPGWWRKRADEIEAQAALTGSSEAMRCYTDMRTLLQAAAEAAPQQEAKEPIGWTTGIAWRSNTRLQSEQVVKITRNAQPMYGYTIPLYTTPQPAAPQAAPAVDEQMRKDAERYRLLRYCDLDAMAAKYWPGGQVPINEALDAAIDAALAAQGGA